MNTGEENTLAPICLFTYNRLSETKLTIEALQKNFLAGESNIYIFSDGGKNDKCLKKVTAVRNYLKTVSGFKSITIKESAENKGLANSIISGVTEIIDKHEKVIVLEDDLVTMPNFLHFMNHALDFYADFSKIFSISGYTMDLPSLKNYSKDFYLGYRGSSWGWATWKNRWDKVDWVVKDYGKVLYNPIEHKRFMRGGSDMPFMLWKQMHGKVDSWAVRWCFHQFRNDLLTVFPSKSKLYSVGFGKDATHTAGTTRFNTDVDSDWKKSIEFSTSCDLDMQLVKEFKDKFSVKARLLDKIKLRNNED